MSYKIIDTPVDGVTQIFLDSLTDTFDYQEYHNFSLLNSDHIKPVQIQRNFEDRAEDKTTVDLFRKNLPSMREYHLQIVKNPFPYETNEDGEKIIHTINKGLYLSDGCTRRRVYQLGEANGGLDIPQNGGAILTLTEVKNAEEMESEYYSHDSSTAVETVANKLAGVIRLMKIKYMGEMSRGKFVTVLRHAYPGIVSKSTLVDMLGFYKTPSMDVDKSNLFDASSINLKKAQFKIAAFMFSKLHLDNRNAVVDILTDLANANHVTDKKLEEDRLKNMVTGRTLILTAISSKHYEKVFMADAFHSTLGDRFPRPTSFFLWALEKELAGKRVRVENFDKETPKVDKSVIKEYWVNDDKNYYRDAKIHLKSML